MIPQVSNTSTHATSTYEKFTKYLKETKVVEVAKRIFAYINEKYNSCKSFCKEKFAAFKASFFTSANTNPGPRQRSHSDAGVELTTIYNSAVPSVAASNSAVPSVAASNSAVPLVAADKDAVEPLDDFLKLIKDGFNLEQNGSNLEQRRKTAAIIIQKFVKPKLHNQVVQKAVESGAKPTVEPQRSNSPLGFAAIALAATAVGVLSLKQNPQALSRITEDTKVLAKVTSDAASHLLGKAAEGVSFGFHHLGKATQSGANFVKAVVTENISKLKIDEKGFSYNLV